MEVEVRKAQGSGVRHEDGGGGGGEGWKKGLCFYSKVIQVSWAKKKEEAADTTTREAAAAAEELEATLCISFLSNRRPPFPAPPGAPRASASAASGQTAPPRTG